MSRVFTQAPHIHSAQFTPAQTMPDFAKLLGAKAWNRLHPAIQRRFSGHDLRVSYAGTIEIKSHFVGTVFACLLLPFGRPLPFMKAGPYATCVNVFPNNRGIVWQRDFLRGHGRNPIRVESVKQLDVDGNLLECVRSGKLGSIGMGLTVFEKNGALYFASHTYFLRLGKFHLPIPTWLTPGKTLVAHIDEGGGRFRFRLTMTHSVFGCTAHQEGVFLDPHGGAI